MQQINEEEKEEGNGVGSKKEQTEHKLQLVMLRHTSGGTMKEEIITFTVMYGLTNVSRKIIQSTQREFCTSCYNIMFFTVIFQLLVEHAKLYYQKHLSKQVAPRSLPDNTLLDKITVLYLILQMRHFLQDKLQDRWSMLEQLHTIYL
jgi:heme/copper-type cytochrome/quinol oxidase subunit 4